MAIRRVTGAVSPSELIFADANALGATYDGSGTTIERGETFTLPAAGTTAVSNGALRLEALKGDCTITNNGNSTLTNASGVDGTIVMRSGASDFPAFVRNSSMGSMSTPAREDFTGDVSGTVSGTINTNTTFPAGHIVQVQSKAFLDNQTINNNVWTEVGTGASGSEGDPLTITMAVGSGNKILFTGSVSAGGNSRYYGIIITKDNTGTYTWAQDNPGPATGSIFHGLDSGNKARILAYIPINDSITHNSYQQYQANFNFLYTPGDTSSHTYTLKAGSHYVTGGTNVKINSDETFANNSHTARTVSTMTAFEVVA